FTITALTFSADGKWLAVGNDDGNIDVWEAATGKQGPHFGGGSRPLLAWMSLPVTFLAFSPDGKTIPSANDCFGKGSEGGIRLWEVATRKLVLELTRPSTRVIAAALSQNGRMFALSGEEKTLVAVWDLHAAVHGRKPEAHRLESAELERRWADL